MSKSTKKAASKHAPVTWSFKSGTLQVSANIEDGMSQFQVAGESSQIKAALAELVRQLPSILPLFAQGASTQHEHPPECCAPDLGPYAGPIKPRPWKRPRAQPTRMSKAAVLKDITRRAKITRKRSSKGGLSRKAITETLAKGTEA